MIHDDTHGANHQIVYQQQIHNEAQVSLDSYFERDVTQQISDDSSLYGLNLGTFNNIDTDLRSINSEDLIRLADNESGTLNELLETSNTFKMTEMTTENSPKVIPNVFPNLEEHDHGGYKFELNLNSNSGGKHWHYSAKLQKVFIKLDQTFYIEALYSPPRDNDGILYEQHHHQQLYLRAMMVYIDDVSSPVRRCHNHRNSDLSSEEFVRHYILRSENSGTKYEGESDGRNVNDRLSILIPLSHERPNEDNIIKKTIALKFVCQNSCIGRKPTAVIFTLEDQSNHTLGKRIVNVKICSCPKRDKLKDEAKFSLKRSATYEQNNCPPHKIPSILKIKEEPTPSTSPPSQLLSTPSPITTEENNKTNDFPEVQLAFTVPKHLAHDIVNAVFDKISGRMALDTKNAEKYRKYLKEEKKKLEQFSCTTSCRHGSGCTKF